MRTFFSSRWNAVRNRKQPNRTASRRRPQSLVIAITLSLVGALPLAMLPNLLTATPAGAAAVSLQAKSAISPKELATQPTLPTVSGGLPGTGEGTVGHGLTPTTTGETSVTPDGKESGITPEAVVGTPPVDVLPGFLNMPNGATQPNSTDRPSSTYDAAQNQVVDFGGCLGGTLSPSCTSWSSATWTFNGTNWTQQTPAASPSGRTNQTLTYDPSSSTAVLFGGENASGALSDTWVWNGTTWTQSTGTTHPSARYGATAAYEPSTGLVYLFGGKSSTGTYLNDTWSWNGSSWTQLTPATSPTGRALASLAYSGTVGTSANDLVLFGGTNSGGDLGDTWLWNGTTWSEPTLTEGPGPLEQTAFVYDPTMTVPLLYGGIDGTSVTSAMWAWNGSEWIEGGGTDIVYLYGMTMAQDPTNGQLVVNGGEYSSTSTNFETFSVEYINGHPRSSTEFNTQLDDRLTQTVNPTDTDVYLQQNDFDINGVGEPLDIAQNYDMEAGCLSKYVGCFWTAGILDVDAHPQPDGHSVALVLPDGSINLCQWGGGTTWTCPPGSDLSYNGTSAVELHSQTTYTFNTSGQISTIKDRNGHTITVNYGGGVGTQATSITDTEGRTTSLTYSGGYLSKITDPAGRTVSFGYFSGYAELETIAVADPSDPTGTATTSFASLGFSGDTFDVKTPAGREIRYGEGSMDRINNITQVTNTTTGAGDETSLDSYDNDGKVVITNPDGNASTYSINSTGNEITNVVDPLGHTEASTYNGSSDPQTYTNGLTQITNLTWDTNNNLNQITAPPTASGQTAVTTYNAFNTPTSGGGAVTGGAFLSSSSEDPQGNCSAFSYDAAGNQTATYSGLTPTSGTTNCDGRTSNPSGPAPTAVTDAYQGDGATTCGGKTGELCTTTSGAGNVTNYAYDTLGELTSVTQPGGSCVAGSRTRCTTITYDSLSRPATVTDGKGQKTTYSYDKFDRITQILYNGTTTCSTSAGTCIQYSYDADGNVLTRVDKTGTTTFTYDTLGRLVKEALPSGADACSGSSPAGITFTYDAASNLTQYCDAGGAVNYAYDAANRNVGTATGSGSCTPGSIVQPCTVYAYDAGNELTGITYPTSTGVTDTLGYDGAGNVHTDVVTKGSTNLELEAYGYTSGTSDKQLQQLAVNYITDVNTNYSYDNQNRLLGASTGTASTSDSYTYDADGNLKTETLGGGGITFAYNAADAACWAVLGTSSNACSSAPSGAVTYTYDADGNLTASSSGEAMSYNSVNQTTSLTPAGGSALSMAYTGTDSTQRTSAGSTTFANSIFGVASSTTGSTSSYFTYDPSGKVNSVVVGGTRYYAYYDGTGSIAGLVNSSGSSVATYSYDPYGATTSSGTEASANPLRSKGGYQDQRLLLVRHSVLFADGSVVDAARLRLWDGPESQCSESLPLCWR
jgi:YD repeat-containing protein